MLLTLLKTIFVVFLTIIFLYKFGFPALSQYLQQETVLTQSKVLYDPKKPPAVTIMPWNKISHIGWKNYNYSTLYMGLKGTLSPENNLQVNCKSGFSDQCDVTIHL